MLNPLRWLEGEGFTITYLPVDGTGRVDPEAVRRAVTGETILISIMHANNEVGTIQPLAEIGTIARERGILLHTDAAQSVGKIPTRVDGRQVRRSGEEGRLCPIRSGRFWRGEIPLSHLDIHSNRCAILLPIAVV